MRFLSLVVMLGCGTLFADERTILFPNKADMKDVRLGKPKDLNGYFPFTPPTSKDSWNDRAKSVREQLLVANGLWPMPEKTPLKAVIHGKIEREGYTVERVYFASMPGHYVSGNLYRPTAKSTGPRPAILSPHGHWPPEGPKGGRFHTANDNQIKADLKSGAEQTAEGAKHPLQARCAQLARMGFIVFHYDMVGYADSQAIKHRTGFTDVQAEHRLQSFMGLQTWNSVRSLDFVLSLPDVDAKRIGMTGASGGGSQTFITCAIDDRPAAAFPAVMVSTAMQGGCVCENCSYLRIDTGNVEFAGMFAPKPLGMSAAKDWTIDMETKGLPELKKLYALLGVEDKVTAKCWPEFGHNYNQVAREMMYSWFNKHLLGGSGAVKELPYKPATPEELSVYDATHPRPKDELDAVALRKSMTEASDKQMQALQPKDAKTLGDYRHVVGTAFRVMVGESLPKPGSLEVRVGPKEVKLDDGIVMHLAAFGRKGQGDMLPMAGLFNKTFKDRVVLWVHPEGKASLFQGGKLNPAAKALIEKGFAVVAPDVYQTGELKGEKPFPVNTSYAGFTYGYNRPVFAQRVHDIFTATMFARDMLNAKTIHLIGWEGAGPWVAAARALSGDAIQRTAIDLNQFSFENITKVEDENMLPGAVKYGGVSALLSLCAPHEVFVHNHSGTGTGQQSRAAYEAANAKDALKRQGPKATANDVVEWISK